MEPFELEGFGPDLTVSAANDRRTGGHLMSFLFRSFLIAARPGFAELTTLASKNDFSEFAHVLTDQLLDSDINEIFSFYLSQQIDRKKKSLAKN